MIQANDAVIWVNDETQEVMVKPHGWGRPEHHKGYQRGHWYDPIGAAYSEWKEGPDAKRVRLMLERNGRSLATVRSPVSMWRCAGAHQKLASVLTPVYRQPEASLRRRRCLPALVSAAFFTSESC